MGRIAKMWASLEHVQGLKMALCLNNFFFCKYSLYCFPSFTAANKAKVLED